MSNFFERFHYLKSHEECKILLRDVLRGYTVYPKGPLYIKHLTFYESISYEEMLFDIREDAAKRGLPSEVNMLKTLKKNGAWTEAKEQEYQDQYKKVRDLRKSKERLIIPEQRQEADRILLEEIEAFKKIAAERGSLIGLTVEEYESRKSLEFYVFNCFFTDPEFKNPLFQKSELDEVAYSDIVDYFEIYSDYSQCYNELNFKKLASSPPILNLYLLSKSCESFFGRIPTLMTLNQINLAHRFAFIKNIIEHPKHKPVPEHHYDNLDEIAKWYDTQYNVLSTPEKGKK